MKIKIVEDLTNEDYETLLNILDESYADSLEAIAKEPYYEGMDLVDKANEIKALCSKIQDIVMFNYNEE
tara:strand:+ start:208 stop:414 length:207 start_codon:yes stop_codon:yes gene_type:complete